MAESLRGAQSISLLTRDSGNKSELSVVKLDEMKMSDEGALELLRRLRYIY